jgi:hypothetical protein
MKLVHITLALCLLLTGCKQKPKMVQVPVSKTISQSDGAVTEVVVPVAESELTDAQKIALLRAEAHKRHLRWRVWCADLGPDWMFQGWAVQPGDNFYIYAENGAKPNWNSHGATQAEAAYNLFAAIQQAPDDPMHKTRVEAHEHKQCPPELRGE